MNLALKYRPCLLVDLVGQQHNARIISNIVGQHKAGEELPAVFLFAGSRGTGKTTTARIVAKLFNCPELVFGEYYASCNTCETCVSIDRFKSIDVVEIDAASYGSVDHIRALKERTMYESVARVRMFIIDECHSMSKEAFDALLKLFEEPPEMTVFVLCTTELEKLPDTIISRAMLFEFRRLSECDICKRLEYVAGKEKIDIQAAVLTELATKVNGSLRDALIGLTQLILYAGGNIITIDMFEELFGVRSKRYFLDIVNTIVEKEVSKGLELIGRFYSTAGEIVLIDGLIEQFKDMLIEGVNGKVRMFPQQAIIEALKVLWDIRIKVKHFGLSTKIMLEIMYIMLVRVLSPQAETQAFVGPVVKRTVGIGELNSIFGKKSDANT